ncbi:MAG: ImuA family protein [Planctomycetota bacterium]
MSNQNTQSQHHEPRPRPGDRSRPEEVAARVAAMIAEASEATESARPSGGRRHGDWAATPEEDRPGAFGGAPRAATADGLRSRIGGGSRDAGGRRRRRMAASVAEGLRMAESHSRRSEAASVVPTGWGAVDRRLAGRAEGSPEAGGLARGQVHEWFAVRPGGDTRPVTTAATWRPPMTVLAHLAGQAASTAAEAGTGGVIAWVGHRVWPSPGFAAARERLDQSIYLDPPDEASRLWTLEVLLRSPAITAVVADGSGLSMAATRRLQLAARSGRVLVLLARPEHELLSLSAAATRWTVEPVPTTRDHPEWRVSLRRCKAATGSASVGIGVGLAGRSRPQAGESAAATDGPWRIHWNGTAVEMDTQDAAFVSTNDGMPVDERRETDGGTRVGSGWDRTHRGGAGDGRELVIAAAGGTDRTPDDPVLARFRHDADAAPRRTPDDRFGRRARIGPAA